MATHERAIEIAARAHAGQKDKSGSPYILHPLRVMLCMHTDEERIAAVLHDVLEDSTVTLEDLKADGFSDRVLAAVEALTKRGDEDYEEFVFRVAKNPIAREVKIADLQDNMERPRLNREASPEDRQRLEKYQRALSKLEASRENVYDAWPGIKVGGRYMDPMTYGSRRSSAVLPKARR